MVLALERAGAIFVYGVKITKRRDSHERYHAGAVYKGSG